MFPIYRELREPTTLRVNTIIGTSVFSCFCIYELISILGFLTLGTAVSSNIIYDCMDVHRYDCRYHYSHETNPFIHSFLFSLRSQYVACCDWSICHHGLSDAFVPVAKLPATKLTRQGRFADDCRRPRIPQPPG